MAYGFYMYKFKIPSVNEKSKINVQSQKSIVLHSKVGFDLTSTQISIYSKATLLIGPNLLQWLKFFSKIHNCPMSTFV